MRQRIFHGAEIDVATPDEIATLIAVAFDRQNNAMYRREKGALQLDATGAIVTPIGKAPPQYDWICERLTVTAGAGAVVQFYENQQVAADLLEVVGLGTAGLYSDSFANRLFVPSNSQLIMAVSGGVANGPCTYNLQIRLIQHR